MTQKLSIPDRCGAVAVGVATIVSSIWIALVVCVSADAQMKRFGPASRSSPASISVQGTSEIQSTPAGTTGNSNASAQASGKGNSSASASAYQITTPSQSFAGTDSAATNGELTGGVTTQTNTINTPTLVGGSGQSFANVRGSKTNSTGTQSSSTSNFAPTGNSASGFSSGFAKGTR